MPSASTEPLPRSRPFWPLVAAASLVPALLNAFTAYINSRFGARGHADWGDVIFAAGLWLLLGALTPLAYLLARRYPLRREALGRAVAAHSAGALALWVG